MGSAESTPTSAHRESHKQLVSMGFSDDAARTALEMTEGNVQRAAQLLLEQQELGGTPRQQPPPRQQQLPTAAPARPVPQPGAAAAAAQAAFARLDQQTQQRQTQSQRPGSSSAASQAAAARAAAARAAALRVVPDRKTMPSSASSGLRPEEKIQQAAQRLVGRAEAVDVLITSLSRILENPREEKYRKVNISNPKFQQYVAAAPGGMEFMYAVGFEPMHGHLVNQRQDLALLWIGKSSLEALRTNATYQSSKEDAQLRHALALSKQEFEVSTEAQRAAWLSRVPDEPPEGEAGVALICFHTGETQTWRRFESHCTLEDLIHFARSLPRTPLGDIQLTNVTMSPVVVLDEQSKLGLTLQRLDLWPAGHVRVTKA
tara:strand:- start:1005 stop:2126 length:1122 start_codon:yes stop_codon:yes gene_type:complete